MGPLGPLTHYDVLVTAMVGADLAMAPLAKGMAALAAVDVIGVVGVAVDAVWRFFPYECIRKN